MDPILSDNQGQGGHGDVASPQGMSPYATGGGGVTFERKVAEAAEDVGMSPVEWTRHTLRNALEAARKARGTPVDGRCHVSTTRLVSARLAATVPGTVKAKRVRRRNWDRHVLEVEPVDAERGRVDVRAGERGSGTVWQGLAGHGGARLGTAWQAWKEGHRLPSGAGGAKLKKEGLR